MTFRTLISHEQRLAAEERRDEAIAQRAGELESQWKSEDLHGQHGIMLEAIFQALDAMDAEERAELAAMFYGNENDVQAFGRRILCMAQGYAELAASQVAEIQIRDEFENDY